MKKQVSSYLTETLRRFFLAIQKRKTAMVGALILSIFCPVLGLSLLWNWLGNIQNPYLDFFNYLVFAPLALLGLVLLVVGIMTRGGEDVGLFAYEYLREQLIMPGRHARVRKFILLISGLSVVLLLVVAATFYGGVHYSDTTGFCANFCHTVMEPHATTHANSSHSRVSCVSCHIAEGAGWSTRTKLAGARQLIATIFDSFQRPIPSPIVVLRPTERACRSCHRPEKHSEHKLEIINQFLPDEANTQVQTLLLMKIGASGHYGHSAHGIHWHTSETYRVRYISAQKNRNDINSVEVEGKDGKRTMYTKDGRPQTLPPGAEAPRLMDCMDCHNRAGHPFLNRERAIDQKLLARSIPVELPYIKQLALAAFNKKYRSRLDGKIEISRDIHGWYEEHYPLIAKNKSELIKRGIAGIIEAWEENVFPAMAVAWGTYANRLDHVGCFRCHNDTLRDTQGKTIPAECDTCHIVLAEKISPAQAYKQFGILPSP